MNRVIERTITIEIMKQEGFFVEENLTGKNLTIQRIEVRGDNARLVRVQVGIEVPFSFQSLVFEKICWYPFLQLFIDIELPRIYPIQKKINLYLYCEETQVEDE